MIGIIRAIPLLIICVICVYNIYKQNKKNKMVGTYAGIMFSVILYYLIVPVLVNNISSVDKGNKYIASIIEGDFYQYISAIFSILLFVIFFTFTYKRYNKSNALVKYVFSEAKFDYIGKIVLWISFLVGLVSFTIYIQGFGGVNAMLSYSEYLRSFATSGSNIIPYYAAIMVIPARLITVVPILSLPFLKKGKRHRYIYITIFVISFFYSVIFLISDAGRTAILLFILMLGVPLIRKITKHAWKIAIIGGVCSLPILSVLDSFFLFISGIQWTYKSVHLASYLSQFSYPFANILNMQKIVDMSGFRWCKDFIIGFLNCIPGLNFAASHEATSRFYGGSHWQISGGTPNDIITFGYMELSFLGIILVAVLLGIVTGKIDRMLRQFQSNYAYQVVATSVIVNMFSYVVNADIIGLLRSKFQLTLICICILYSCRKSK